MRLTADHTISVGLIGSAGTFTLPPTACHVFFTMFQLQCPHWQSGSGTVRSRTGAFK